MTWPNSNAFFLVQSPENLLIKKLKSTHVSPLLLLPGDALPNAPVFCLETGGRTTHGQIYKRQGCRGRGRSRGKVKPPSEASAHTEVKDDTLHLKERHTLAMSSQEETAIRVSSLDSSPILPKLGVGRRTSILFKKAKNGAKLTKSMLFSLQNRVTADQTSEKLSDHRSQPSLICTPPTPKFPSKENGMEIKNILFNQ